MLTLAHAFISSRVDFCNSLFLGVSSYLLDRLQSIMNATARLILNIPKFAHISDEIRVNLHWLPIRQRISYKVCFLVRNCLAGAAPKYLSEVVQHPVVNTFVLHSETTFWCLESGQRILVPEDLLSLDLGCGTHCLCLFVNCMTNRNNLKRHSKHFLCSSSERFCGFISEVALYQIFITITITTITITTMSLTEKCTLNEFVIQAWCVH